jgi:hypothetical protein
VSCTRTQAAERRHHTGRGANPGMTPIRVVTSATPLNPSRGAATSYRPGCKPRHRCKPRHWVSPTRTRAAERRHHTGRGANPGIGVLHSHPSRGAATSYRPGCKPRNWVSPTRTQAAERRHHTGRGANPGIGANPGMTPARPATSATPLHPRLRIYGVDPRRDSRFRRGLDQRQFTRRHP